MSTLLKIAQCGPSSVSDLVRIHEAAFHDRAMTALGTETVRRYYASMLSSEYEVTALSATLSGEVAGFCVGGHLTNHIQRFLQDNLLFLTGRFLRHPWLAFHGLVRDRAILGIQLLLGPLKTSHRPPEQTSRSARVFNVRAIAVHPDHHRQGVGRELLSAIEGHAIRDGFSEIRLAVNLENEGAIQFYENLSWERLPGLRASEIVMRKPLPALE